MRYALVMLALLLISVARANDEPTIAPGDIQAPRDVHMIATTPRFVAADLNVATLPTSNRL